MPIIQVLNSNAVGGVLIRKIKVSHITGVGVVRFGNLKLRLPKENLREMYRIPEITESAGTVSVLIVRDL
jgi:hypothetical protein